MAIHWSRWFPKHLSLPDSIGDEKHKGQTHLTAREIPVGEQMNVGDALSGTKLIHELAQRMLVEVDGIQMTPENRPETWARFTAKQRDLLFKWYREIHVSSEDDSAGFRESEAVTATEG
jgi:hypothetical protein